MNTTIFIPKKISVGFQERSGTYTGKLAYIIYFDEKGILRKEASWNSWRDNDIEAVVCDNEPTSGFVLNKKVGGYSTGWNHRQTYCRIYDPRGFEFEITISNLLYILENTNSIIGKGLEGEFVYGWDGKDLILIPTSSPDYKELMEYNKLIHEKNYVKTKDLVIGGTYRDKHNVDYVYLGRFDYYDITSHKKYYGSGSYDYNWVYSPVNKGKHHFFGRLTTNYDNKPYLGLEILKSLGQKFISVISSECAGNYADLYEMLENRTEFSPHDETKDEYIPYTLEEFIKVVSDKCNSYYNSIKFFSGINSNNLVELDFDRNDWVFCVFGKYDYRTSTRVKTLIGDGSAEFIFNKYKPVYRNEYLANGKFYRKVEC